MSSIGWNMWPREIPKVSARFLKQEMNSNRGNYKLNFGNLEIQNPAFGGVKRM
jgi:hypothetical protein